MSIFDKLINLFGITQSTSDVDDFQDIKENGLMVTVDDFKKLTQETYIQQTVYKSFRTLSGYFMGLFDKTYSDTAAKIRDAKRLKRIFPELNGAENLLASSILSPTNFLNFNINFTVNNPNLTEDQKISISKQISDYFNNEFKLPDKLHKWLIDIIGTTGSKPVLILPHTALQKLRESGLANAATESLSDILDSISENKIYDTFNQNTSFTIDDECYTSIAIAFESITENSNELNINLKPFKNVSLQLNNEINKYFESKKVSKSIQFIEDPSVLLLSKQSTAILSKKASKKLDKYFTTSKVQYKAEPFIDLGTYVDTSEDNYPIVIELPSEAVIPIAIPGNPSEHIGYIVLLDQFGNPLTTQNDIDRQLAYYTKKDNYLIKKLYTTMYANTNTFINSTHHVYVNVLKEIYEKYLDYFIKLNLSKIGFQNITISFTNAALSTMLTRILAGKKTRMLFVPEEFITYFAISFNDEGIGESKTEEIKFIAALRMTYIITRLFGQMQDSVNSRRLLITFDKNIPNPLELAKKMKQNIINERIFDFSYEPTNILKTLLDKEISVIPRSLPGVENFSIEDEPRQRSTNRPDDSLIEHLDNMSLNGLEIPPSVFNQLRESEFSRSVLTNNIFYGLRISRYQEKITTQLNKFIRTYLKYFTKFQQTFTDIITPEKDDQNISSIDIINFVKASLPPLKLGFDTNAGKIVSEYTSVLEEVVNQLFPNDAVPDDLRDNYEMYKAMFKAKLVRKFLQKAGLFDELDIDKLDVNADEVADFIRYLQNFSKGIDDLVKAINSEEE